MRLLGFALPLSLLFLALLWFVGLLLGPAGARVPPHEVYSVLVDGLPLVRYLPHSVPDPSSVAILWELRLPRLLTAAIVGALLGYAGVALQGLLMNPLADPYTVGVASGAAVGAALTDLLGIGTLWFGFGKIGVSFGFALFAVVFVYLLARVSGRVSVQTFLLSGVIVGTFLWSLIPLFLTLTHDQTRFTRIVYAMMGTLSGADWRRVVLLLPFLAVTAISLRLQARELDLMTLGEESAAHLGVATERFKRRVLAVGSLATAAAVAFCGVIGFVGLVVPHIARRLLGPAHRTLLPFAAVLGAILLTSADILVRVVLDEMPVGVITSLVGAPFFCTLLRRNTVR
jgi:iron complex transport system permease protein